MAYVLDIRVSEDASDGEAVATALAEGLAAHGTVTPDEGGFRFTTGGTRLQVVRTGDEAGRVDGVDVGIPYGAVELEVGEALDWILSVAADRGDRVFDPQLGRSVRAGESGAVLASFAAASSYAVDYAGQVEDARAGVESVADTGRSRLQVKILGGVVVLLVTLWLLFQSCVVGPMTQALSPPSADDTATVDGGPPPGWMAAHPTVLSPGSVKVRDADADGGR